MDNNTREIETEWRKAYEAGAQAWPDVCLDYGEYLQHVMGLGQLQVPAYANDLYLATACQYQVSNAQRVFERTQIRPVTGAVRRIVGQRDRADDVLQELRRRVLAKPLLRIRSFCGRGALQSWTRRAAIHLATDSVRVESARHRHLLHERLQAESLGTRESQAPDEVFHRRESAMLLRGAISNTLMALSNGERCLLYHYYFQRLSIDVLGSMYGVDRSTMARRIQRLMGGIRKGLKVALLAYFPGEGLGACHALADISGWELSLGLDAWLRPTSPGCSGS